MTVVKIAQALEAFIREQGWEQKLKKADVLRLWSEIAGSMIASRTKAEKIIDGVLYITVENPAWRNELVYQSEELRVKLNQRLGTTIIKEIKLK